MTVFLKLFDLIPGWIYVLTIAAMTMFGGVRHMQANHYRHELANSKMEAAKATLEAEKQARARENSLRQQVERIATNAMQRQTDRDRELAAAHRANAGLRDTISSLNARPAPADPVAASYAHEAGAARELLGACAQEYRAVAAEADKLSDQVTALQEYASSVSSHD